MSRITDMVFVLPAVTVAELKEHRTEFEALVQVHHGFEPTPIPGNGSKIPGGLVYFLGMNYLSADLVDEIMRRTWPDGTILYTMYEQDEIPRITVFGTVKPHTPGYKRDW